MNDRLPLYGVTYYGHAIRTEPYAFIFTTHRDTRSEVEADLERHCPEPGWERTIIEAPRKAAS